MTETVLIPNPNQIILLRELQKVACFVPSLPLCVRCEELSSLKDKISKADVKGLFVDGNNLFLSIDMEVNGKACEGRIELGEKRADYATDAPLKIKKISPFRIVEMELEESTNGRTWKVKKEKWGKI